MAWMLARCGLPPRIRQPDYGFALHSVPFAAGTIHYRPGVLTSNSDGIEITIAKPDRQVARQAPPPRSSPD
jgi:hypothetical protein